MSDYEFYGNNQGKPVYGWTKGVPVEAEAIQQLRNTASLPFVHHHVAAMPDVHVGKGATVGSVIATEKAIIPAAVGVDIGCGMIAAKLDLTANDLPDSLTEVRNAIEAAVPVGKARFSDDTLPKDSKAFWRDILSEGYDKIMEKNPKIKAKPPINQVGTLGGGNHFVEVCLDEEDSVWVMLHSGSRGVGNKIGTYFTELAKKDMERFFIHLPDKDLAYLVEGTEHFDDYIEAMLWAQDYASANRQVMLNQTIEALKSSLELPLKVTDTAINCHHNYAEKENHFGKNVWTTRKGAVRARRGDYGIIPGSMGARSYIVRGKGNPNAFHSCSHGAGRVMSRSKAKQAFTLDDHLRETEGVECRKDSGVLDETPGAYKDIDSVMAAQEDLVEVVATLKQVVCVKG